MALEIDGFLGIGIINLTEEVWSTLALGPWTHQPINNFAVKFLLHSFAEKGICHHANLIYITMS